MTPLRTLWDFAFPTRCGLCRLLGDRPICRICESSFQPADSHSVSPEWRGALDGVARIYVYEGRAEQAVRRLKYSRATSLARPMANLMAEFASRAGLLDADLIVPVPIHWTRRSGRGFNQSDLLCESLPRIDAHVMKRTKATRPQVGLNPQQRRRNLIDAFQCAPSVVGKSVLLVDDVITTGHTVDECARTLKRAGAISVRALAFCGGEGRAD